MFQKIKALVTWAANNLALILSIIMLATKDLVYLSEGSVRVMHLLVCFSSLYYCYKSIVSGHHIWGWILGTIAVLLNPFYIFEFEETSWSSFYSLSMLYFIAFMISEPVKNIMAKVSKPILKKRIYVALACCKYIFIFFTSVEFVHAFWGVWDTGTYHVDPPHGLRMEDIIKQYGTPDNSSPLQQQK